MKKLFYFSCFVLMPICANAQFGLHGLYGISQTSIVGDTLNITGSNGSSLIYSPIANTATMTKGSLVIGADNLGGIITSDYLGGYTFKRTNSAVSQYIGYTNNASQTGFLRVGHARGSISSPSGLSLNDQIGTISFYGYIPGFGFEDLVRIVGSVSASATNDLSAGLDFYTQTSGNGGATLKASLDADGGLVMGSPTGGSQGLGTVNAVGLYDDGVITTDFVFEPKYKYLTMRQCRKFVKKHKHLPTIKGMESYDNINKKPSVGEMISQFWETIEVQWLYISELEQRVSRLEKHRHRDDEIQGFIVSDKE